SPLCPPPITTTSRLAVIWTSGGKRRPRAGEESGALRSRAGFVGTVWQAVGVRTAHRCRAYPDAAQQAVLNRTFGCVRVVWNGILAVRQEQYVTQRTGTSYGQASAALTAMKRDPERAWLNEVSCVPLQQALRHQQQAFAAFFARRARYPR